VSLHLVFSTAGWHACKPRMLVDDTVVLLGDGIYVASCLEDLSAYGLTEDFHIRGIELQPHLKSLDYPGLVALCTEHHPIVSWKD
jgi:sulfur relay protein TusB/DsrH